MPRPNGTCPHFKRPSVSQGKEVGEVNGFGLDHLVKMYMENSAAALIRQGYVVEGIPQIPSRYSDVARVFF